MKYALHLVFSLLLFCQLNVSFAKEIELSGTVYIDEKPLPASTVIVYEHTRKVIIHSVVATDKDGEFTTTIKYKGGDLDIRLLRDKCDWKAQSKIVQGKDVVSPLNITIKTEKKVCN
jgi:hypothetical protein